MNATEYSLAEKIDLLVDGELDLAGRAEILATVERTEGAWRHCALAFLEAQLLGESLAAPEGGAGGGVRRWAWWRGVGVAAALAVAFIAGTAFEGARGEADGVAGRAVAVAEAPPAADALSYRRPLFRPIELGGQPGYTTLELLPPFMLEALVDAGHRVRHVERVMHLDSERGEPIELPLVETHIVDMRPQTL